MSRISGPLLTLAFACAMTAPASFASAQAPDPTPAAASFEDERRAGMASVDAHDFDAALAHFQAAERIAHAGGPANDELTAAALQNESSILQLQGDHLAAIFAAQAAVALLDDHYGPGDARTGFARSILARVYDATEHRALAYETFERAAPAVDTLAGTEGAALVADFDLTFGNVALEVDAYAVARERYDRALALRTAAEGPRSVGVVAILDRIGALDAVRGAYGAAIETYRRAAAMCRNLGKPCERDFVTASTGVADAYAQLDRYGQAEPPLRDALRAAQSAHDTNASQDAGIALMSLLVQEGRYAEGFRVLAAVVPAAFSGSDDPSLVAPDPPAASIAEREAELAATLQDYGPRSRVAVDNELSLAAAYGDAKRDADARATYDRADATLDAIAGVDPALRASSFRQRARFEASLGNFAVAQSYFQRALAIHQRLFGDDHESTMFDRSELGDVRFARGDVAGARDAYLRATDTSLRLFARGAAYASENDRVDYARSVGNEAYAALMRFCWYRCGADADLTEQSLDDTLAFKGAIARNVRELRLRIVAEGGASARRFDAIVDARRELATLRFSPGADVPAGRKRIHDLASRIDELEQRLMRESAAFAASRRAKPADWRAIAARLGRSDAAIAIARTKRAGSDAPKLLAFVIRHTGRPAVVPLPDEAALEGAPLAGYRELIGADAQRRPERGFDAKLYDAVWRPLEPALRGATRVYVAPDGDLTQIAFGVLPDDRGRPLYTRYDVRVISSVSDLPAARSQPDAGAGGVLVGDPAFDPSAQPALAPLPGSALEVRDVARAMHARGWRVTALVGAAATKPAFERIARPRVLHVATHGFFLETQPRIGPGGLDVTDDDPMLRSGLELAGKNGTLTALEASGLDLNGTQLVVLSACDSGLGSVEISDGVFGLRRGFHEAGAADVMMSMWPVPDRETRELMDAFYARYLAGMEMHAALAHAMSSERAKVIARYGRDIPRYWGAFVIDGA